MCIKTPFKVLDSPAQRVESIWTSLPVRKSFRSLAGNTDTCASVYSIRQISAQNTLVYVNYDCTQVTEALPLVLGQIGCRENWG